MATFQTFQELFNEYYVLYRGDNDIPATSDAEFAIAVSNANAGIRRWLHVDNVFWNELYTTLQTSSTATSPMKTFVNGTTNYATPSDMLYPGGFVILTDPSGNTLNIPCLSPEQQQIQAPGSVYSYFVGDPNNGFTLVLQGLANQNVAWTIDYVYYKHPTYIVDGTTIPQMADPAYIIHFMLAQRFRASRNWPAYQTALKDAEEALKGMQNANSSGTNYNSWDLNDNDLFGRFGA